ncbi:MAG TPA: hypothetical protein VLE49_06275 [Anaerolineales bacterium]|nr:hypothetical protein [Anaerolineales bacterium]
MEIVSALMDISVGVAEGEMAVGAIGVSVAVGEIDETGGGEEVGVDRT